VKHLTAPKSTLKKHENSIGYHRPREAKATGFIYIALESGEKQIGDSLTQLIPAEPRLKELIGYVLLHLLSCNLPKEATTKPLRCCMDLATKMEASASSTF
jgi:MOSC domain-containing protein YiiM